MTSPDSSQDRYWMRLALAQAQAAGAAGEVPVGAVVVRAGSLIATGRNAPMAMHDPTAHAEIMAMRAAAAYLGNYRLQDCELFVTLEPCTMCAGAMLHARLKRMVFGAPDPKTGAAGSVINVFSAPQLNHHTHVLGGLMAEDCARLLQDFFKRQRGRQQLANTQAGRALRDDALRAPECRFEGLPDMLIPSFYVNDLPSLAGLRLHYFACGLANAPETFLCLHRTKSWSYAWRSLVEACLADGKRVVCPDLIGFGKSDKIKKATGHSLQWHAQIVLELIDRLALHTITLIVPDNTDVLTNDAFTHMLVNGAHGKITKIKSIEPDTLSLAALDAPFSDAGHRAALRAFADIS